jgi:large subunit ribosomal protein L24
MTESSQPRKQRKRAAEQPLHRQHRNLRATLDEDLRDDYDTRRVRVGDGDTVEVMRGDFAGETGDVVGVDLEAGTVQVDGLTDEKVDGEEVYRPIDASNVRVTALDLDDPEREDRIGGDGS